MTNNKDLEARLLDTTKLNDDDIKKLKYQIIREEAQRERKKIQESKNKVIIKDFYNEKVQPFGIGAVYDVYNKVTHTFCKMNGASIEGFISANDNDWKNFNNKLKGSTIEADNKEFVFLHYEIN